MRTLNETEVAPGSARPGVRPSGRGREAGGTGWRVRETAKRALKLAAQAYTWPTVGLRALPDFLIIGAQRAGTTSLYRYLEQHPAVAPAFLEKGVHYFDTHYDRSLRWYRTRFPTSPYRRARTRRAGVPAITGEGSPYYLFHPAVPRRVAEALPDVRLLVMLRDPVTRAYSHHQHEVARGYEDLSFDEAVRREPERLAGEEERLATDPRAYSYAHQHHSYLARGRYLEQLLRWKACVPRERLLVVIMERFFADPDAGYREVMEFLGLPAISLPAYEKMNAHRYPPMEDSTRAMLREHFAEPNRRLAEHLGVELPWST